jgi:hypothetical protein
MTKSGEIRSYLFKLIDCSRQILAALPIERTPQPLDYALGKLRTATNEIMHEQIINFKKLNRPIVEVNSPAPELGIGMNSVGMLTDRLTILLIKEWCLRNKPNSDADKADRLYSTQTLDVVEAMVNAKRSNSAMNAKITNIKADTRATCWEEAYYGLLITNLLMWESQEVLYIKDIAQLPYDELKDYIKWFSFSNIIRNEFIQHCEEFYWRN